MNLGSETIHIRLYILTFSYILLIMCFALYKVKKNQATNETPMHGTRTGCMAIYKKTPDRASWSGVCGVVCTRLVYCLIIFASQFLNMQSLRLDPMLIDYLN